MDVHDKIENKLEQVCEALGWNSLYVSEYTEAAAIKASAIFQAFGYDYGDRTPGVYKIQDIITECVNSVGSSIIINTPKGNYSDLSCSTGMFRVNAWFNHFDDDSGELGQWEFEIYFDLLSFSEHRIRE